MSNSGKNTDYQTVVIQRDYRDVITKFEKEFPIELSGKINQNEFEYTIDKINKWLETAESIDATSIFQECIGCLTFFTFFLCFNDKYKTCVNKIKEFIKEQNETVYSPKGVTLLNPINNGFIKIEILVQGVQKDQFSSSPSTFSSTTTSQSPSTLIPTNNASSVNGTGVNTLSSSNTSNIELSPMNTNNSNNNNNNNETNRLKSTPSKHSKIDIIDDRMIKKPETIVNVNLNNNNIVELSSDEDSDDDAFENESF